MINIKSIAKKNTHTYNNNNRNNNSNNKTKKHISNKSDKKQQVKH